MVLINKEDGHVTIFRDKDIIGVDIRLVATMQPKTYPLYDLTIYTVGGHAIVRQNIPKVAIEVLVGSWCNEKPWSLVI